MKEYAQRLLKALGLGVVTAQRLEMLKSTEEEIDHLFDLVARANRLEGQSRAQLRQDLFVLLETGFKTSGFFVEFGATNGIDLSNTYLLENRFSWTGILAEPAKIWHEELKLNRSAIIDHDCVWSTSGESVSLNIVEEAEFSTIEAFSSRDRHASKRQAGIRYEVNTVSLFDLLRRHNAPAEIDYLSIDTEGSEFAILSAFDFASYDISIITCEHNFTNDRKAIFDLLSSHGYERKFTGLSKWDDWYVKIR